MKDLSTIGRAGSQTQLRSPQATSRSKKNRRSMHISGATALANLENLLESPAEPPKKSAATPRKSSSKSGKAKASKSGKAKASKSGKTSSKTFKKSAALFSSPARALASPTASLAEVPPVAVFAAPPSNKSLVASRDSSLGSSQSSFEGRRETSSRPSSSMDAPVASTSNELKRHPVPPEDVSISPRDFIRPSSISHPPPTLEPARIPAKHTSVSSSRLIPFLFTEGGIRYLAISSQVLSRKHYNSWFKSIFEMYFHDDASLVFYFLRLLLQRELEILAALPQDDLDSTNTIFRSTTAFTSFLTIVSETLGHNYLLNIIATFVGRMVLHQDTSLSGQALFEQYYTSVFLSNLIDSSSRVPLPLRQIYALVAKGVKDLFPKFQQNAVANMFFLRFICPSLLTPGERCLWTSPMSSSVKSALMLSSKDLQSNSITIQPSGQAPKNTTRERLSAFISELINVEVPDITLQFDSRPSSALILTSPYFKDLSSTFTINHSASCQWMDLHPASSLLPLDPQTLGSLQQMFDISPSPIPSSDSQDL